VLAYRSLREAEPFGEHANGQVFLLQDLNDPKAQGMCEDFQTGRGVLEYSFRDVCSIGHRGRMLVLKAYISRYLEVKL
jgi:hypothetical protein